LFRAEEEVLSKKRRVMAVASGGGHWMQLKRIAPAFADLDVSFVSVLEINREDVAGRPFFCVTDASRANKLSFVVLTLQCLYILLRVRPRFVVTTGAAPGLIMLALAKMLLRSRTLWLDSIANSQQLSLSGQIAKYFADVRLTQWPSLAGREGPSYWGSVL
jgi:UDP-N-acetylglucosamine:LPS N-acetylglucosamine transferase